MSKFLICIAEEMQMNCIDGGVLCSSMHNPYSLHRNCWPHFIFFSVSFKAYLEQVSICSCDSHYGISHLLPFSFFFSCKSCQANAHHRSQVLLSQYLVSLLLDRGAIFTFWSKNSLRTYLQAASSLPLRCYDKGQYFAWQGPIFLLDRGQYFVWQGPSCSDARTQRARVRLSNYRWCWLHWVRCTLHQVQSGSHELPANSDQNHS